MVSRCALILGLAALGLAAPAQEPTQTDKVLKLFQSEFVKVKPGAFLMGSKDGPVEERPSHEVKIAYSFEIAKYEVTQDLYEAIMGKNPSKWRGPRNSVEMVDWDEANTFCTKITDELRKRKLIDNNGVVRLPSEAEWEYCCRASTPTPYSFGDDVQKLGEYCWFTGNAKGNDPPVGAKKANPWGLYDMHGYVWEWCADLWHPTYEGAPTDGGAWTKGESKLRVLRGGSWEVKAEECRSASRVGQRPQTQTPGIGFRCVLIAAP